MQTVQTQISLFLESKILGRLLVGFHTLTDFFKKRWALTKTFLVAVIFLRIFRQDKAMPQLSLHDLVLHYFII